MTISVRRAELQHLDLIVPLFDAYRQFYDQEANLELARSFLEKRLKNNESVIFLASDNQTGLGFTQLYPVFSSISCRTAWILNDLFVAPDGRKKGIASALMQHAEEFARESGAKGMELATHIENMPAQQLYEKRGWIRGTEFLHYEWNV